MRAPVPLRPELASVCRFVAAASHSRIVRPVARPPLKGVLRELDQMRGLD